MKTVNVSDFKARCIALVKEVQSKHETIVVTIRGKPMAEDRPVEVEKAPRKLGGQSGSIRVLGDIVSASDEEDWDVLRRPDHVLDPAGKPL